MTDNTAPTQAIDRKEPGATAEPGSTSWLAPLTTGVITVLVGFTGTVALLVEALKVIEANAAQTSSALLFVGLAMAVTTMALSWSTRMPIVTAWSTPGAALIASSAAGLGYEAALGAFVVTGLLLAVTGSLPQLQAAVAKIPAAIASGMLAGVLLKFGIGLMPALVDGPLMVGPMLMAFLAAKRWLPRYALPLAIAAGVPGLMQISQGQTWPALSLAVPVLTMPQWTMPAVIGLALPLYLVTMASQNIAGATVLRAAGYQPPVGLAVASTGVASMLIAPFGGQTINLAAITAAICASPECDPDPRRRWLGGLSAGVTYAVIGLLGASAVGLMTQLPRPFLAAVTGLALLSAIAGALATATHEPNHREAGIVAAVVTASGVSLYGIGPAFWGLTAGLIWLRFLTK